MTELNQNTDNPDSEHLGYHQVGDCGIGYVYEVNGPGSRLCPSFAPTVAELGVLARHHLEIKFESAKSYFYTAFSSGSGIRREAFADRRLLRIKDAIGEGEFEKILAEFKAEQQRQMGDRHWTIFMTGSREEWDEVAKEFHRSMGDAQGAPGYAVNELSKLAVERLPELPADTLARALKIAANDVQEAKVHPTPCNHDWAIEGPQHGPPVGGFLTSTERCTRCQALRHVEIPADR